MSASINNDGNQLTPDESWTQPLDSEFVNKINHIKYNLYQTTVFGPSLNTTHSQDNVILNTYLGQLNALHDLSQQAQKGKLSVMTTTMLEPFPSELRGEIEGILQWLSQYFQKNGPSKTIPYTHYLESTLRVYPFVQHPNLTYMDVEMTDAMDEMDYSMNTL